MEPPPTPYKSKSEPEGPIENIKKFEALDKENKKYEISIYKKGNNLIVETEIEKNHEKIKYSNYYNLISLKENNKFLSLCDSIDAIIETIYQNASIFSCAIDERFNDYEIKIPVPVKNLKEISFTLKERKKSEKQILDEIIANFELQKNKTEEQHKEIEEQKKKIENQEHNMKDLNKKIEQQEEKLKIANKIIEEQNKKIDEFNKKLEELKK